MGLRDLIEMSCLPLGVDVTDSRPLKALSEQLNADTFETQLSGMLSNVLEKEKLVVSLENLSQHLNSKW